MRTAGQGICAASLIALTAMALAAAPASAYAPTLEVSIDPSAASTPTALTITVSGSDATRTVAVAIPSGFGLGLSGTSCDPGQESARACPEASRVGVVSAATSAGDLSGNIYYGGGSKLVLLLSDGAPVFPKLATFEGSAAPGQVVVDGLDASAVTLRFAGAPRALLQTPAACGLQTFTAHLTSLAGEQADARSVVNVDGCTQLPPQIAKIAVAPRIARAGHAATLRFSLTEDAAVELRLRRAGSKREHTIGTLDGHAGENVATVATRGLRRGTYLITVMATDATGLSRTKSTRLRVHRR
jgi:hypothetical protein